MRFLGKAILFLFAFVGLIASILLGTGAVLVSSLTEPDPLPAERSILTLTIDGPYPEQEQPLTPAAVLSGSVSAQPPIRHVVQALTNAATDPRIAGLMVYFGNSPIGVGQAQEIRDALIAFRVSGKPAYGFAETMGEGGNGTLQYYMASALEQVWLQPSGLVATLGFAVEMPFLRGLLDDMGVMPQFETRKDFKTAFNSLTEYAMTEPQMRALSALVDGWTNQVVQAVSAARSLENTEVRRLIDRSPLLADEARTAGLVDALGYRDEVDMALATAAGTEARLDFGAYMAVLEQVELPPEARRIALVTGTGPIILDAGDNGLDLGPVEFDARTVANAINDAVDDPEVAAIVLRIDSPGGSYVGSDVVWRSVRRARDKGMPIIASLGDVAASGGYYVAMGADRIVAQPGTLTGSIGVVSGKFVFAEAARKWGVTWDGVSSGRNARMFSPAKPFDYMERQRLNAILDAIYADFTGKAAEARDLDSQAIEAAAQGRVWTGTDAREMGLVDDLGGLALALTLARDEASLPRDTPLDIRVYPQPSGMEAWIGRLLADTGVGAMADGVSVLARLGRIAAFLDGPLNQLDTSVSGPLGTPFGGLPRQ